MGYLYSEQFNKDFGDHHYYAMPERGIGDTSWNAPAAHISVSSASEEQLIRPNAEPVEYFSPEENEDYLLGVDRIENHYGGGFGLDSPQAREQRERPQMFLHHPEKISGVSRNPRVSPAALSTLLGVVLNKHPNAKVDNTLTESGSRLARKGVEAGAIKPHEANSAMTPNTDWEPFTILGRADEGDHVWDTTPLSSEDVEAGRQTMRNLIRGNQSQEPTPKPMGPQFTQPELPGMS